MKQLFLSSSFSNVIELFTSYVKEEVKEKRVTFIPTASIHEEVNFYVEDAKKAFEEKGMILDILEISTASSNEIKSKLANNDYIYISGGNTFFLLQELKRTGADKLIFEQINLGKIYIGESAGSVVVTPNIEYIEDMDNKKGVILKTFESLGLIDFYVIPHYKNFPFAKAAEITVEKYKNKLELVPFSNDELIVVSGNDYSIMKKIIE